jgi:preprotein translocase subunit YajC
MGSIILNSAAGSSLSLIVWLVVLIAIMYFLMIRPQRKEQKRVNAMLSDMAVGDSVVTTSGFYGVILDITDDDVIVEFGNNKNCRIPMRKSAIAEVEKADAAYETPADTKKNDKDSKKADAKDSAADAKKTK